MSSSVSLLQQYCWLMVWTYVTHSPKMRWKSFLSEFEVWLKSLSALYSDEIGAKLVAPLPKLTEICLPEGCDPLKTHF